MRFNPLPIAADYGRWVLVIGLCAGAALPKLAHFLFPWIPQMVVVLLFLAVLRLEPRNIFGALGDLPRVVLTVLFLQLAIPLMIIAVVNVGGWVGTPLIVALVLVTSAPSIVGSPNMCIMLGNPPIHAMRLLVVGTALLPITVLPVFWFLPELGAVGDTFAVSFKLFLTILLTAMAAIAVRMALIPRPSNTAIKNLDGLSAIMLAVFVIGLMSEVFAAVFSIPETAFSWLLVALIANFGLQVAVYVFLKPNGKPDVTNTVALIAGNRNLALFLVALSTEVTAPIMIFVGCYQFPMYLTPLVMRRLYT